MTIFIIKYGNYLTKNMTDWSVTWSSRSLYNHIRSIFEGSIAKYMDLTGKCGRKVIRTRGGAPVTIAHF